MSRAAADCGVDRRTQHGIATVEMAIGAPVMMLLLLGIAEVGRAFVQFATLSNAVRNGARYVSEQSLNGSTGVVNISSALTTQAQNLVAYGAVGGGTAVLPGLTPGQVTVVDAGGGNVTVSATYPFAPSLGDSIPDFGLGGPVSLVFNLSASVTLRATGGA